MLSGDAVAVPVFLGFPLRGPKCRFGVGGRGEGPRHGEVGSISHEKDALPALGYPVISSVQQTPDDLVLKFLACARDLDSFQPGTMVLPFLVRETHDRGIRQLKDNVTEVSLEGLPGKSLDVFKDEGTGLNLPHGSRGFREQVPAVLHGAMLSPNGKGLARRASGHQVNHSTPRGEILLVDIALDQWPMPNQLKPQSLVRSNRFARVMVEFQDGRVLKSGLGCRQGESTSPREKLDTLGWPPSKRPLHILVQAWIGGQ